MVIISNLYLKCELALANCYFSRHSEVLTVAVVVSLWNVFWFSFIGLCEEGLVTVVIDEGPSDCASVEGEASVKGDVTVVTEEGASDRASLEDEVRYCK